MHFMMLKKKPKQVIALLNKLLNHGQTHSGLLISPRLLKKISVTVFKVTGETNTDDLSPAPDAWSRPDIPLHALAMLKIERDGITPDKGGEIGPITQLEELKNERTATCLCR